MKLLLLILVLAFNLSAFAQPEDDDYFSTPQLLIGVFLEKTERISGKVVGVHDGDTCMILDKNNKQYKIRFDGIDAPELKQDFGQRSKQHLSDLIFGKEVIADIGKADKYGRRVAKVYVSGIDVNLQQIKAGLAWHYKKYAGQQTLKDRTAYAEAEKEAQSLNLGLWQQPNRVPPWEYRGEKKVSQVTEIATRQYLKGSRGGCYYINSSGKKTYVNKTLCN